jgi:acetolactate synthase I/II/III large subunit
MQNHRDGGEAILDAFRKLGIDYIMSSPGSEWSPVWEALARQSLSNTPGPTFIETWHETLAADMAIGYTYVTGRAQAVLLHAGVGLLHGSMGIFGALQGEIPMIVMSGESLSLGEDPNVEIEPQWYGGVSVVGGAQRLAQPFVKWANQVTSPYTLHESVIRAGEMAERTPQGPVYLDVPLEYMVHEWTPALDGRDVPSAPRVQAHPDEITKVVALLLKAKNPVIVTETSGRDPKAVAAMIELAELLAVPVIDGRTSVYANFPKNHPLFLGVSTYQYLKDADLVLLVSGRAPWYPPRKRPTKATIVSISDNPVKGHLGYQNINAEYYLEGEVASSLLLLAEAARAAKLDAAAIAERRSRWTREHDSFTAGLRAAEEKARGEARIDPIVLLSALSEILPDDAIFMDETITHGLAVRQHLRWTQPQSYFRIPNGGLGQGLGLALGIKLASPKRPVVLLVGDGGLLYNPIIQALAASKRYALPILIVVVNNGKYEAMKHGHVLYYPEGAAKTEDKFHGVEIDAPDFAEFGVHFGFPGQRVDRTAELDGAIRKAFESVQSGTTAILNVIVSR